MNKESLKSKKRSPNWKGGRKITDEGYVLIYKPGFPGAHHDGYVPEHRFVMSQFMGRPITKNEIVHHINGDKQDNRIENLKLYEFGQHTVLHHTNKKVSITTREKISIAQIERFKNSTPNCYKDINPESLIALKSQGLTVNEICSKFLISRRTYYNKTNKYTRGEVI